MSREAYVYLAGPILGQTEREAKDWRQYVAGELGNHRLVGISPLRCEPIHGERYGLGSPDEKFGTARAIASKNLFDVRRCDATLAYMPFWSHGTVVELAWAHAMGKPTILVADRPEIAGHPVVNACAGWVVPTLDDAIEILIGVLGAYTGGHSNV